MKGLHFKICLLEKNTYDTKIIKSQHFTSLYVREAHEYISIFKNLPSFLGNRICAMCMQKGS